MFKKINIKTVIDITKEAGVAIMALRPKITVSMKSDNSPVTEADKQASDIIMTRLKKLTPDIPVISEEAPQAENQKIIQNHKTYWITDPLDGTRSYIDGHDGFGVHLALIHQGVPIMGFVHFPAQGMTYYTGHDQKAYKLDDKHGIPKQIHVSNANTTPFKAAVNWRKHERPLTINRKKYQAIPGVGGARLCLAAEGAVDLAWVEKPFSYWDVAAAHAVLRAAGGDFVDAKFGKSITYGSSKLYIEPSVGGSPQTLKYVMGFRKANGYRPPSAGI